jgi:hypothetical protein
MYEQRSESWRVETIMKHKGKERERERAGSGVEKTTWSAIEVEACPYGAAPLK